MLTRGDVDTARETVKLKYPNMYVLISEVWHPSDENPQYRVSLVDLEAEPTCSQGMGDELVTATELAMEEWELEHK